MNVMIIDDDENVRKRLKSIIDWQALSANLVCEAKDSDSAMELYLMFRPKVIIADINIPVISGLDLAEQIQKEDHEVCFIIITGFNDLELAKKAFELQTVSLLTKPIQPAEINDSISAAIQRIEEARQKRVSESALQQLIINNLPEIQQNYIENLMRWPPENSGLAKRKLQQLALDLQGDHYIVVLIRLYSDDANEGNQEAVLLLLRDLIAAELSDKGCTLFAFLDSHMRLNCVVGSFMENPDDLLEQSLIQIQEQINYKNSIHLFAGIGAIVPNLMNLNKSYDSAKAALKYQSVLSDDNIIQYKNMDRTDTAIYAKEPVFSHLLHQFRTGNLNGIEQTIRKQLAILNSYPDDMGRSVRNFFLECVTWITSEDMRLSLDMVNADKLSNIFAHIFQCRDRERCIQELLTLSRELIEQIQHRRVSSANHLVLQSKEYIKANLQNESLDLEQVSSYVGLSRIYFCKLFHQVMAISFTNYLKNERVKLAKTMLLKTNMKVLEISKAAGFSSTKYFGYVFKQIVGQTPLEYQKEAKKSLDLVNNNK
jgi:two-component system response regulator YesN